MSEKSLHESSHGHPISLKGFANGLARHVGRADKTVLPGYRANPLKEPPVKTQTTRLDKMARKGPPPPVAETHKEVMEKSAKELERHLDGEVSNPPLERGLCRKFQIAYNALHRGQRKLPENGAIERATVVALRAIIKEVNERKGK
jgi:hypothetical protein